MSPAASPAASLSGRVAFVLKGYPRLSETFIAQEIAALERRGLETIDVDQVQLLAGSEIQPHRVVHDVCGDGVARIPEGLLEK